MGIQTIMLETAFHESQDREDGVKWGRAEPGELQVLHRREQIGTTCTSPCVLGAPCVPCGQPQNHHFLTESHFPPLATPFNCIVDLFG